MSAADVVFVKILALSSTDTVVLQGLSNADAVIFIMILAFLNGDTVVFTMILAFLRASDVIFITIRAL